MMNKFTRQYRRHVSWRGGLTGLAIAGLIGGCASGALPRSVATLDPVDHRALDRVGETIVEDSRKLSEHQQRMREQVQRSEQAMRELPVVAPVYDPLEDKVVTINMYDTEVGHLLWALADQLGMNLIVDPQVLAQPQRASLYLKNVTAREVYNHILRIFDLHGETRGGALVVSLMEERVFDLDLLNTTMSIDVSSGGNVFGSSGGASGGGSGGGGGSGNQLRGNFLLNGNSSKQVDPYEQVEQAVSRILGVEGDKSNAKNDAQEDKTRTTFALNHMTGSLYVRARPTQVASIDKIVDRVQTVMHRQVQVEAQLIDVQLNDGFEFGVDWNLLRQHVAGVYGDAPLTLGSASSEFPERGGIGIPARTLTLPAQTIGSAMGRGAGLIYGNDSFSVALSALRSFGNVKVLSNPSVRVRNGTPALLSVGTNTRFVAKSAVTIDTLNVNNALRTADVQTDSLFSGIIVGVVPFIHENGSVELLVHPMQTEVDPASLALVDAGGGSRVTLPVVNFKGITTTLNLNDGDTVLIGGLIDQKTASTNRGLPGASDVPVLGQLFDDRQKKHASRELVVVLRARVL